MSIGQLLSSNNKNGHSQVKTTLQISRIGTVYPNGWSLTQSTVLYRTATYVIVHVFSEYHWYCTNPYNKLFRKNIKFFFRREKEKIVSF